MSVSYTSGRLFKTTCLFSCNLARQNLRSLHNTIDVGGHICSEGQIERPRLSTSLRPYHDFVSSEQTQLLFKVELIVRQHLFDGMELGNGLPLVRSDNDQWP